MARAWSTRSKDPWRTKNKSFYMAGHCKCIFHMAMLCTGLGVMNDPVRVFIVPSDSRSAN